MYQPWNNAVPMATTNPMNRYAHLNTWNDMLQELAHKDDQLEKLKYKVSFQRGQMARNGEEFRKELGRRDVCHQSEVQRLNIQLNRFRNDTKGKDKAINNLKDKVSELERKLNIQNQVRTLNEIDQLKNEIQIQPTISKKMITDKDMKISKLEAKIRELEQPSLIKLRRTVKGQRTQINSLDNKLKLKTSRITELEKEIQKVKEVSKYATVEHREEQIYQLLQENKASISTIISKDAIIASQGSNIKILTERTELLQENNEKLAEEIKSKVSRIEFLELEREMQPTKVEHKIIPEVTLDDVNDQTKGNHNQHCKTCQRVFNHDFRFESDLAQEMKTECIKKDIKSEKL